MADDAWMETCLISIAEQSGADVPFQAVTETVDIDLGDKEWEGVALVNGGRVNKLTPEADTTITFEAYPLQAGSGDFSAATTGAGFFDLLHSEDTSQPYEISNSRTRKKFRIAIMWTDDTSLTNANAQVVSPTNSALRIVAADGYITSVKPSFTDGILKFTVKFKVPPFDKSGNSNIQLSSVAGAATATLTALASYTSSTKF